MKALCSCGSFAEIVGDGKCTLCYSIKPPKPKVNIRFKKRKASGQLEMFRKIYDKANGEIWCEKCGKPITEFDPSNFHHTKFKSLHGKEKLNPKVIQILCFDCHFKIHNLPKDKQGIIK